MKIKKINSMFWATAEHDTVGLNADTDDGENLDIGTPYNDTSIIWDAVRAFPVDQITPYVPPPEPPVEANLLN